MSRSMHVSVAPTPPLSPSLTGTRAAASRLASSTASLMASSLLCSVLALLGEKRMKSREQARGLQNKPPVSKNSYEQIACDGDWK